MVHRFNRETHQLCHGIIETAEAATINEAARVEDTPGETS
jgi:hypothetical protein